MNKVIVTCAVTGAVYTPSQSAALPVTPQQIAEESVAAAKAGAAILHLHARDPRDGRPTADPEVFMQFLPRIAEQTDAVINITTGGSVNMTLEERLAAPVRARPEMASLNMGSMNFAFSPPGAREGEWQFDWERGHVEETDNMIFRNSFRDIRRIIQELGEGCGTRFEFECYDIGHLYNLAHLVDAGLVKPPFLVQSIFGVLGGIGVDPQNVAFMRATADRLFGKDYVWSVLGVGSSQMGIGTLGANMGGHVRVGLGDSLHFSRGRPARSNAEQVRWVRSILAGLSIALASPAEARRMLNLKGRDQVAF